MGMWPRQLHGTLMLPFSRHSSLSAFHACKITNNSSFSILRSYFFCNFVREMMLELLSVTIGQHIRSLSFTVNDGQLVTVTGPSGSGKTTLLRAILGFIPIDEGYISIDGELVTPLSAPYFRRNIAYVPQDLVLPQNYREGIFEHWDDLSFEDRYLLLFDHAVQSGSPLLIVDEPRDMLTEDACMHVDNVLLEASRRGTTVLAINNRIRQNQVQL